MHLAWALATQLLSSKIIDAAALPSIALRDGSAAVHTWWHEKSEVNTDAAMPRDEVRRSRKYEVYVSEAGRDDFQRSFVYESIPRNGNGKMFDPAVPGQEFIIADGDGISIEIDQGINMAWSQFEYNKDVTVKIVSTNGAAIGPASNVQLRPSYLEYDVNGTESHTVYINIPYNARGTRFSVEFQNDLFQYRTNGTDYVLTEDGLLVSEEPRNALVLFASPPIETNTLPSKTSADVHVMKPGAIIASSLPAAPTLYFEQGIYWMEADGLLGKSHMILHSDTTYVYLEPGTYIKGAIEFTTHASDFYLIGHGVLSGENYAYQANWNKSYTAEKDDHTSLRLISHQAVTDDQTFHLQGIILNAPPFNTVDLFPAVSTAHEEDSKVHSEISDYKQVGAYYLQTDGSQLYAGTAQDIFWHANDDAIKLYHSNVIARNVTIWKVYNDPIVQMGWKPRAIDNVTLDGLDIIHSRWHKSLSVVPSSIIGASPYYMDPKLVDGSRTINAVIKNVRCEGICPALLRIAPMNNYKLAIENVWFESILDDDKIRLGESLVGTKISDQEDSYVEGQDVLDVDIDISNWRIGGQPVNDQNWQANQLGQLNFNASFWGDWSIV